MKTQILPASQSYVAQLARIHSACLPDDFLPSLGRDFLERQYYPAALTSENAVTLVAVDSAQEAVGFVTVASDSGAFSRDILQGRVAAIAGCALLRALREPAHLLKSAQVLFATLSPRHSQWPGEIVFIAVSPEYRRSGIGKELIGAALAHLRKRLVKHCRTKTLAANAAVIRLYESMGWQVVDRYRLIGREYVVLLSPEQPIGYPEDGLPPKGTEAAGG